MASQIHVAMVPWLAFGHLIPFLQLSIALAKAGVRVSFVSSPKNIQRLPKFPPHLQHLINLVALPLPAVDLLPEGAEATTDIPFEKIQYLKIAYDLLKNPFKQFVAGALPDWILIDFSAPWAAEVAEESRIPLVYFSVFSTAKCAFFGPPKYLAGNGRTSVRPSPESMTCPPDWVSFPSKVAYRRHEAIAMHAGVYGENASGITDGERLAKVVQTCQAVAIRTCAEFEGEYLNLHRELIGKPVIPVGLLLPEKTEEKGNTDVSWSEIFKWLDERKPKSVVFVGFGSECKLSRDQVYEIACGLELSELPFLWALRKPSWAIDDADAQPPEFGRRTKGQGVVCMGWAPQMEILAHPSIGGSLFHAGWGSAIEALQFGHCLVVLPFIIDQGLNARLLVEKGLGVEVERGEDGTFGGEDIANSLRMAMVSEEGEQLRARAKEAAVIFGDGKLHQQHYVQGFVEYLKNGGVVQK
ncbi:putative UDP-rhamnose:rhamnosyltransferase 1 [Malania oleifera]|uniref:putative UDP-rhamnose:rhamnosyltransferase 1 n=1 Tax=Malania oleifera TaxID=397392 RepID=UPI0025AE1A12|nr:putative UDP-rhamnose:rhamnosyltransferase 1 [Malania oleifera]